MATSAVVAAATSAVGAARVAAARAVAGVARHRNTAPLAVASVRGFGGVPVAAAGSSCCWRGAAATCQRRWLASAAAPPPPVTAHEVTVASATDMEAFGHAIGAVACAGTVVCLEGPVGGGKSVFARGFVRGATGVRHAEVPSPTFMLLHTYPARPAGDDGGNSAGAVHHMDMYRISGVAEVDDLDLPALLRADACVIEWPQVLAPLLPPDLLRVTITLLPDATTAQCAASPPRSGSDATDDAADVSYDDNLPRHVSLVAGGPAHARLLGAALQSR